MHMYVYVYVYMYMNIHICILIFIYVYTCFAVLHRTSSTAFASTDTYISLPTRAVRSDHVVSLKNSSGSCAGKIKLLVSGNVVRTSVARMTDGDGALPLPLTCLLGRVCKC